MKNNIAYNLIHLNKNKTKIIFSDFIDPEESNIIYAVGDIIQILDIDDDKKKTVKLYKVKSIVHEHISDQHGLYYIESHVHLKLLSKKERQSI